MPVASSLKTYGRIKTYGTKNAIRRLSNIPPTEASLVFDALFAKNLSKRNNSQSNLNTRTHKHNTRNKQRVKVLPPRSTTPFDDSLDIKINTTFDDLIAGPVFNEVNFAKGVSQIFSENSSDNSRSVRKNINKPLIKSQNDKGSIENQSKKKSRKKIETKNKKGKVETRGKTQKKKLTAKKKLVSSIVSSLENGSRNENNSCNKTNNQRSPINTNYRKSNRKINNLIIENTTGKNALDEPVDYSLIIDNTNLLKKQQSLELSKLLREESCKANYKKDLSINSSTCKLQRPTTSCLTNNSLLKPENDYEFMFNNSYQHFMQAESTPKYIKSSTPMISKKTGLKLYNSKLDYVSPITSRSKSNNMFNCSVSLFSDVNSNVEINVPQRLTRSVIKNKSFSAIELSLANNGYNIVTRSNKRFINNTIISINDSDSIDLRHKSNVKQTIDINNSKENKFNNFLVPFSPNINQSLMKKRVTCNIIENTPNSSMRYFKRQKKNYKRIQILDSSSDTTQDGRLKSVIKRKTCSTSRRKILTKKKDKSKEVEEKFIQVNLVEWEEFTKSHSVILAADSSSQYIEDPDIEIIPETNQSKKSSILLQNTDLSKLNVNNIGTIYLKPGKHWRRSLSIVKQNKESPVKLPSENNSLPKKGRKWRTSVFGILVAQDKLASVQPKRSILTNNGAVHNRKSYRPSIRVISLSKEYKRSTLNNKKIGYVSTITDDTVLENFSKLSLVVAEEREKTAKEIILKRCNQTEPLLFDECYSLRTLQKCRKIGEGVYGEVFMYKNAYDKCVVMKIIPIEGEQWVNGEHQKKYEEIISEIIISTELSNLRTNSNFKTDGFAEVLKVCLVQGKYPQHLIDLWDLYDEDRGSENDSPVLFTNDQLYIVLELANGGQDLEAYHFNNAELSYSLYVQIACTMAVAEAALQFEHRDLHWGNVLISPTDEPMTTFRINGREFEVPTKGVKLTIIDFTLSRMTSDECCIFNDLAMDPDLFTATGDYQFEIYRLMRKRNNDDWQKFEPYSNILWLDYILEKMISQLRYIRINSKTHKNHIRKLSQIRKKILSCNSVMEFINSDVFSNVFI